MPASTATATRPGARATARYLRMSASKVRVVLDLIRGKQVAHAIEILSFSERLAAQEVLKCLNSAIANAEHNEDIPEGQLYISACFADQGPSLRRYRPRARGRAGRINKQTCHVTIEVSRLTDEEMEALAERQERKSQSASKSSARSKPSGGDRARRVAKSKAATAAKETEEAGTDEASGDEEIIDAEIVDTGAAEASATGEDASDDTDSGDTDFGDTDFGDTDSEDGDSEDTAGDQGEEE